MTRLDSGLVALANGARTDFNSRAIDRAILAYEWAIDACNRFAGGYVAEVEYRRCVLCLLVRGVEYREALRQARNVR